jgi:hypothetical protein
MGDHRVGQEGRWANKLVNWDVLVGHAKKIFCFSDSAGLFLADYKKNKIFLINIPDIMIMTGQEYSLERALLVCY